MLYYFNNILAIAQQCPYSGGGSVFVARNFIELFNDSLFYDDAVVCLSQGIYRQGQFVAKAEIAQVQIQPNPTKGTIAININGTLGSKCQLVVKDVVGQICFKTDLNCKSNGQVVELSSLNNGVYLVSIISDSKLVDTQKLILIK